MNSSAVWFIAALAIVFSGCATSQLARRNQFDHFLRNPEGIRTVHICERVSSLSSRPTLAVRAEIVNADVVQAIRKCLLDSSATNLPSDAAFAGEFIHIALVDSDDDVFVVSLTDYDYFAFERHGVRRGEHIRLDGSGDVLPSFAVIRSPALFQVLLDYCRADPSAEGLIPSYVGKALENFQP